MIHGLSNELLTLLAVLCLLPVLFVIILVGLPRREKPADRILAGNPLFDSQVLPAKQEVFLHPLVHTIRTTGNGKLQKLILGLRHLPVHKAAPILQSALQRRDPELQTYAQSILQQKQEELQTNFVRLEQPVPGPVEPAALASYLDAGLRLASSPLTQSSEQSRILESLLPWVQGVVGSKESHPRLLAASIELCLKLGRGAEAESLLQRLPEGSPLHQRHQELLSHHLAVHQPPDPVTARYEIR